MSWWEWRVLAWRRSELLRQKGAIVRAVDEKPMGEMEGVTVEPQTEAAFRDAELVVISPGVPADLDVLAPCARAAFR